MASDGADKTSYVYNSQLVSFHCVTSEPPLTTQDAFTLYHISHDTHTHSTVGPALPALGHATSGAAGTAISKLITYPLDLVITRLQAQRQLKRDGKHAHYTGIVDAIETIYEREGGLGAFYSGLGPDIVKGVADSFLFFLAYSYVRQKRLTARGSAKSLPILEEIGVGAMAGAFSRFWTTPLQQIVTRKQTAAMMNDSSVMPIPPTSNTADIARGILREKGVQGFWSGYSASLALTLNPSITMLLHKVLLNLLVPRAKRGDPGARLTFLLAATSKALASTVTYPFSLAKTRAQVSSQKTSSTMGETSELGKSDNSRTAQARQHTVFSTILRIAQTEGLEGLYQGLGAEVLKGFFSHGITMFMKDKIHTLIISLYYTILQSLQKLPSAEEVAKRTSDGAKDFYEHGKEQANEVYTRSAEMVGQATEKVKEATAEGSQRASDLMESSKQQASDAYAKGSELSASASAKVQEVAANGSQKAAELYEQSKTVTSNASSNASEQAQQLLDRGKSTASNVSHQTEQLLESGKIATSNASENAAGAAETGRVAAANVGQRVSEAVKEADIKDVNGPDSGVKD
jgi:hypothetical protein